MLKPFLKGKAVKIIISCIVIAGVAGGGAVWWKNSRAKAAAAGSVQQRTARVRLGELDTTVTGSGPITFSNTGDAVSKVSGTITKVYFKQGDQVKAGDLLFELDNTDALQSVDNNQNNIDQTQISQDANIESLQSLNISAPFSGQVTDVQAKAGNSLNKGDTLMTITDTSKMKLTIPVNNANGKAIAIGQQATVYFPDLMQSVEGKVSYVSNAANTPSGGQLYSVDITLGNPGSLKEGMKASAEVSTSSGKIASTDYGTLAYINKEVIRAGNSGTIKNVNVQENQYVNSGALLVDVENEDLARQKETTDLKIQGLQSQLADSKKQLDYYKVYAPISGIIVTQTKVVGNSCKADDVLSTIADTTKAEFTIAVDEMDISKLQVGQKTDITIDALPETSNKPVSGAVSKIDPLGNSSNGVTSYNVSVQLDTSDKVKSGMNANATVYVSKKSNVLMVPLEAVMKIMGKNYVMVKGDPQTVAEMKKNGTYVNIFRQRGTGTGQNRSQGGYSGGSTGGNGNQNRNGGGTGSQGGTNRSGNGNNNRSNSGSGGGNFGGGNFGGGSFGGNGSNKNSAASQMSTYYNDAIPKEVQIGTNNEDYIEVVSGLQEGDEIILPPLSNSQSSTTRNGSTGNAMRSAGAGMGMGGARAFGGGD